MPRAGRTVLVAILYPTRATVGDASRRIVDAGIALDGASDPGVNEARYVRDPEENGIELSRDWPRDAQLTGGEGDRARVALPLDLRSLSAVADS